MVTENSVVDGEECLLTWEDNGKGGKVPLQPGIIHCRKKPEVRNYLQWGNSSPWADTEAPCRWVHSSDVPASVWC